MNQFAITYKIYLEAEDVSATRIKSSTAFVRSLFQNSQNVYLNQADMDDESELEELTLRFYIEKEIQEAKASSQESAEDFVLDLAQVLDTIAAAHSYMEMEGSFSWTYDGTQKKYSFRSESGQDDCEITEE